MVRAELDKSLVATASRVRLLGDDLRAGRISLEGWRLEMRTEIKNVHLRSAALARGGWSQMGPVDFGRAGQIIREEYQHLNQWVEEIKTGLPLDGRLNTRSSLYAQAGRATFHQVQAEEMMKRGMDLVRSVLHPTADHCAECVAERDKGLQEIGQISIPGTRTCGRNCRCTLVFERSAA